MSTHQTPLETAVLQAIRAELAAQGITQAQLAEKVGVGREAMSRYINGRTAIPFPIVIDVSEALGLGQSGLIVVAERRLA